MHGMRACKCRIDTAGNHEWDCPNREISGSVNTPPVTICPAIHDVAELRKEIFKVLEEYGEVLRELSNPRLGE